MPAPKFTPSQKFAVRRFWTIFTNWSLEETASLFQCAKPTLANIVKDVPRVGPSGASRQLAHLFKRYKTEAKKADAAAADFQATLADAHSFTLKMVMRFGSKLSTINEDSHA